MSRGHKEALGSYGRNDRLSSAKLGYGTTVAVYKDNNFGSDYTHWTSDNSWVGNSWNDSVSSLMKPSECVC